MKVFELHFNTKAKDDVFFDSFIYEPENAYEKRLGSLYVVGELDKALPQNNHFLSNLASTLKKEYYSSVLAKSPEASLRGALQKTNEFLDMTIQQGNVSWLGNLNVAVLNFKDNILNFAKAGKTKILLMRNEEILDIGPKLEEQSFGNSAKGKVSINDKVLISTKNVFSDDFLAELAKISSEKELKEFLATKKQILSEFSGICLLLMVDSEARELLKFSFAEKLPRFQLKIPRLAFPQKKIVLLTGLIFVLLLGFLIFKF